MSESSKPVFLEIHATISAANAFMKCLYRAGLWLSHGERDFLLKAGSRCVNLFSKCALRAYNANCTRWKFMPKFHLFGQWLFTLERQKTPWVSKPKHLDVFLSNGRGLCRENQCHFQNGFIEDRSYTDPVPLPDCLGGELGVKYNA